MYDEEEMVRKEENDMEMDLLGAASTSTYTIIKNQ